MSNLVKTENNTAEFTFEITPEVFEDGMKKAFAKNAKHFAVPGFRKGKATRAMVEKMYGRGVLYDDALNFVLPDEYDKAVEELGLSPVDRPDVDIEEFEDGKNIVVKVNVTVKPEVKLGKYSGIELEKIEYNVTVEDIDAEINTMREKGSRTVTIEDRAVLDGDIATIDFEGFKDGVPFDGGKGENFDLTIGSGQFIPGFEEQLIGKIIDEEVNVNVTFPDDYQSEDLAGAPVEFKVKINGIKLVELPELDDEFAMDVSEFNTLDELKNDIKEKLETQAKEKTENETKEALIAKATELTEVDIPDCMIETQLDQLMRDYDMRFMQQGFSMQKYLEMTGGTVEQFREQFAPQAATQVKTTLTLDAIIAAEKLEASDEEVEAEFVKFAESSKMPLDDVKKYIKAEDMKQDLATKKAVDLLVSKAKIK